MAIFGAWLRAVIVGSVELIIFVIYEVAKVLRGVLTGISYEKEIY